MLMTAHDQMAEAWMRAFQIKITLVRNVLLAGLPAPHDPKLQSPFRCFNSSPDVIRLEVLMYLRFQLSLRNVEDC